MNKSSRLLEAIWLILFLVALFLAIRRHITLGFNDSYRLYIVSGVALLMFLYRHFARSNK
jgi:hypothetical protein